MSRRRGPSRRQVLKGAALLGGATLAGCAPFPEETLGTSPRLFRLGVASGDPRPDGVVIWTRLAPDPLNGGGMPGAPVDVAWEVAADDRFRRIVRRGVAVASPEYAHSVHVDVQGLEPDSWYWYRFRVGVQSASGRTRTAPPAGATPQSFRFAVASCQNYEAGFFTAYRHMAIEDLDLVLHLGDYIYEGAARPGLPRSHGAGAVESLADYRNRHALYKLDADLQAAHAAFPWSVVWDDHDVANNYAAGRAEDDRVAPADFLKRRAAAYRAYYEHMPLRPRTRPSGPDMPLYRRLHFGRLATLNLLDTRQYRSDQPCGDGWRVHCAAADDPRATMLGARQEAWLERGLADTGTAWNVLAQQVAVMQRKRRKDGAAWYNMDSWSGYRAARSRLFDAIQRYRPSGLVVLTGDVHATWVGDLKRDFDDASSATLGTEFVGTSISSGGDGWDMRPRVERMLADNPHIHYSNGRRGYLRCRVSENEWRTDVRTVPYVTWPGAPIETLRSFTIDRRRPGVVMA